MKLYLIEATLDKEWCNFFIPAESEEGARRYVKNHMGSSLVIHHITCSPHGFYVKSRSRNNETYYI